MKLDDSFYQQDTITVARQLLGTCMMHESAQGTTVGRVVETEAYLSGDPACHAYRRETKRNQVMFGPFGYAYVYRIYGIHYCVNVVTAQVGVGEAVLVRALEPVEGIELMQARRQITNVKQLCNGPAKLVQAMGILPTMNGASLAEGSLYFLSADAYAKFNQPLNIVTTTRIGITKGADLPYRFYIKNNPHVSYPVKESRITKKLWL